MKWWLCISYTDDANWNFVHNPPRSSNNCVSTFPASFSLTHELMRRLADSTRAAFTAAALGVSLTDPPRLFLLTVDEIILGGQPWSISTLLQNRSAFNLRTVYQCRKCWHFSFGFGRFNILVWLHNNSVRLAVRVYSSQSCGERYFCNKSLHSKDRVLFLGPCFWSDGPTCSKQDTVSNAIREVAAGAPYLFAVTTAFLSNRKALLSSFPVHYNQICCRFPD